MDSHPSLSCSGYSFISVLRVSVEQAVNRELLPEFYERQSLYQTVLLNGDGFQPGGGQIKDVVAPQGIRVRQIQLHKFGECLALNFHDKQIVRLLDSGRDLRILKIKMLGFHKQDCTAAYRTSIYDQVEFQVALSPLLLGIENRAEIQSDYFFRRQCIKGYALCGYGKYPARRQHSSTNAGPYPLPAHTA